MIWGVMCRNGVTTIIRFTAYAPEKTVVDPVGAEKGKHHVIRGSSWKHGSISTLRLAYRSYGDGTREDVGFRVCRYTK